MRKAIITVMAAALVSACGGGEPGSDVADGNDAAANAVDMTNYQAEVIALPVGQQNGVFQRALQDAKFTCQQVTRAERYKPVNGNPAWRVWCGDQPHIISITRDGTANILSRRDAR